MLVMMITRHPVHNNAVESSPSVDSSATGSCEGAVPCLACSGVQGSSPGLVSTLPPSKLQADVTAPTLGRSYVVLDAELRSDLLSHI